MADQQTDPKSKKKILHNNLTSIGLYTKSFEDFNAQFSNPEKIEVLYSELTKRELYTKSSEDFNAQFFGDISKKKDHTTLPPSTDGSAPSKNGAPISTTSDIDKDDQPVSFQEEITAGVTQPVVPEFDLKTPIGIIGRKTKQLKERQSVVETELFSSLQAEVDAGNLTEEAANLQLQTNFKSASEVLHKQAADEVDAEIAGLIEFDKTKRKIENATSVEDLDGIEVTGELSDMLQDKLESFTTLKEPLVEADVTNQKEPRIQQDIATLKSNGIWRSQHILSEFSKSIVKNVAQLPKAVAVTADWIENKTGINNQVVGGNQKLEEMAFHRAGVAMEEWAEEFFPSNPIFEREFLSSTLPNAAGSIAAIMIAGAPRKILTKSSELLTGLALAEKKAYIEATKQVAKKVGQGEMVVGGSMMGVPEYENAIANGLSPNDAFEVFLKNYAIGQTDAIAIGMNFSRMNKLTGGGVEAILKAGFKGGVTEMTQEVIQNYMTNLTAKNSYDEFRKMYQGMLEEGAAGFILGAVIGSAGSMINDKSDPRLREYIQQQKELLEKEDFPLLTPVEGAKAFRQAKFVKKPSVIKKAPQIEKAPQIKKISQVKKKPILAKKKAEIKKKRIEQPPIAKPKGTESLKKDLEATRTEIRKISTILNIPSNRDQTGKNAVKLAELTKKRESLVVQREDLRTKIGESKKSLLGLSNVDENATVVKGITQTEGKTTETTYDFTVTGIEGVIVERKEAGSQPLYYATTKDGKLVSDGHESAVNAVKDLRSQKPRHVSQTGDSHVEVKGERATKSSNAVVISAHNSPKIIRTELGETSTVEGKKYRKMKLFMEGGTLVNVLITPRGKVFSHVDKSGKIVELAENKTLKNHPDVVDLLKNPKDRTESKLYIDQIGEASRPKETDPAKFTEMGAEWARKIRAGKIKPPKGILKSSLGFEEAYNSAMEVAASVMETGGKFVDAFRAAIKEIRSSEWYAQLTPAEQAVQDKVIEEKIMGDYLASGIPLEKKAIDKSAEKLRKKIKKENKTKVRDEVHELIFKRRADLSVAAFETRAFIEALNIETTLAEREMMPFIIEGTGIPENLNRPDLQKAYQNRDVKKLDKIAKEIKEQNDKVWKQMQNGANDMDSDFIENYITHIWDIDPNERTDVISHFTTKNKWASGRYIKTLEEGIEKFGLKPKMLDISEILSVHGSMANNVEVNKNFVEGLKELKIGGKKIMIHSSKKPPTSWVKFPHSSMQGYSVHPDVAIALDPVFETKKFKGKGNFDKGVQVLEQVNSALKEMQLTVSLFHHGALTEAAVPLLGLDAFKAIFKESAGRFALSQKQKFSGKTGLQSQLPYAFQNPEATKTALKAGVQVGASIDIRVAEINSFFKKVTNVFEKYGELGGKQVGDADLGGKIAKFFPDKIQKLIEGNSELLWDYMHDTFKIMAYHKLTSNIPAKFNTPELIQKFQREQAQFVNDSFGGQNFDVLGISPFAIQASKWLLLSPDWTISTLRQAAPFVLGVPFHVADGLAKVMPTSERVQRVKTSIGRATGAQFEETTKARIQTANKFWIKTMLIFGAMYNMYNAWNRKEDQEEHPELYTKEELNNSWSLLMTNNTGGHLTHVFDGRYKDGTERYIRVGKQFRELPELFIDDTPNFSVSIGKPAIKKLGGKGSPIAQLFSTIFTGKTLSGYENHELKGKDSWEWTTAAAKTIATSMTPFSASALFRDDKEFKALDLVFPSSKGMSESKGIKYMQHYMSTGDTDSMMTVMRHAMRNNLNHRHIFTVALSNIKREMTKEITKDEETVEGILKRIKSGGLSPKELKSLSNKAKIIQKEVEEKKMGELLIIKNMGDWLVHQAQTGDLDDKDHKALEKAIKNFELETTKK